MKLRSNEICSSCGGKYHSIINYEVKDEFVLLTKHCLACGFEEKVKRTYRIEGEEDDARDCKV